MEQEKTYSGKITIISTDGDRRSIDFDGDDADIRHLEEDTSLVEFVLEFDLGERLEKLIADEEGLAEIEVSFSDGEKEVYSVSTLY